MANLTGKERAQYVREMFSRIADRYDLMNRIMTGGQDIRWREEVIRRAMLPSEGRLLDLGAGTGDLGREAVHQYPECQVLAADFTMEMMRVGRSRREAKLVDWVSADALDLPFSSQSMDAVVSGFLLRNVIDIDQVLREQYRVLKPGGKIVALDTTPPPQNLLSPLINFHLHVLIPLLGSLLTKEGSAYTYLPNSTENFLEAEQMVSHMMSAGFKEIGFQRLMFRTIAIYWGRRPKQ
jgi:demethylmenaquinone methyltransferase/2-methoxy-6-polyprenyl-1,4-benzoquinol methylase